MQEQQDDSPESSRNCCTDKPRQQENINMGGKFQATMHNNKWKDAIDLETEQIKEYQVFKDYGKAVYEKDKIGNMKRSEYILSLMSNSVEDSKQDLCRMDILPKNLIKLSTQELFL